MGTNKDSSLFLRLAISEKQDIRTEVHALTLGQK